MATITIHGVGVEAEVEVQDGESYGQALERAGFAGSEDLDVSVDGAPIENPDETPVPVAEVVTTVVATPKEARLG